MEDVQRNSHAQTRNNARLMEKKTSSKKGKYGSNPFCTCLLSSPLGFSSLVIKIKAISIVVDFWWKYIDEHCFE